MLMMRTLVIHGSKYGSTEEIASAISMVLGPSRCCRAEEFRPELREFELVVLGTPIYKGMASPAIWNFIREGRDWLSDKPVALFCTCLNRDDGKRNIDQLQELLGGEVIASRVFDGRMQLERLDEADFLGMEVFSKRTGTPFESVDHMDMEAVAEFALELKRERDTRSPGMDRGDLRRLIEAFLASHKICTLTSGHGNRVRATPIEYNYRDGSIYMLSEGGEKFAHILLNPNVSIAVYDEYVNMATIGGIQISGTASIVAPDEEEYQEILKARGLRPERIASLSITLNVIRVRLERAEFLYAKLKARGDQISQVYDFPGAEL